MRLMIMREIKLKVNCEEEAEAYILDCEKKYNRDLEEAIEDVFAVPDVRTIALSGPTCSGKTTTARKLTERIINSGRNAVVFSIDDFFKNRDDRNNVDGEAPDYDSVEAIDLDYFNSFMSRFNMGIPALVPHYEFEVTSRTGYDEYCPDEKDICIFEGIQAVYPEVTRRFEPGYRSIFISVLSDVAYHGSVLTKHDERLLRRLVRDYYFRGATPEFTLFLWHNVRDNEEKNIYPNAKNCDVYINSYMPYEPFVLARHALPILETVPMTSEWRDEADDLIERLCVFDCPYFRDSMIPSYSFFREFIGDRNMD